MPFIILGIVILVSGIVFYRFGVSHGSHEIRNGALTWLLAGFLILVWGLIIIFSGKL